MGFFLSDICVVNVGIPCFTFRRVFFLLCLCTRLSNSHSVLKVLILSISSVSWKSVVQRATSPFNFFLRNANLPIFKTCGCLHFLTAIFANTVVPKFPQVFIVPLPLPPFLSSHLASCTSQSYALMVFNHNSRESFIISFPPTTSEKQWQINDTFLIFYTD